MADVGVGVRAPAPGERVEAAAVGGGGRVAERDRRLHERGVGVAHRLHVALRLEAVEPAGVGHAVAQLRAAEQLEQEALVGGALVERDHRVGDRAAQARDRLLARAPVGDDLGDHRVEVRRDGVALGDAGVDADARPARQAQQRDPAGRGREAARRVLGVEADLDRVAARRRRLALQPPAGGDVELQADEIDAGDHLGHGVLDLQPRVDLHERELPALRLVEELGRAGAAIAGRAGEPHGRVRQPALLVGRERRARRLLDDLLMTALVGAVADAERPHRAVAVGHQLDLDVPGGATRRSISTLGSPNAWAASARARSNATRELVGTVDAAHPAPAAARGGLDHQRVPDPLPVRERVLDALHGPAAPRCDRDAGLLGQPLRLDLVSQRAHDVGIGADEDDPEPLAQLREARDARRRTPSPPRPRRPAWRRARARARRSPGRPSRGRGSAPRRPGARTARAAQGPCRARSRGSVRRAPR